MRNLRTGGVEIGSEPTSVCIVPQDIASATLKNTSEDVTVFVGGPHVAAQDEGIGYPLSPGESKDFLLFAHDSSELFAVTADGSALVIYLVSQ
jgi:hypothetical protein